ncbi:hypothetical protein VC03_02775 [Sneathia vaginalis]|uniref:Uncharacterized protein n=1 Tax=Sneathia vaginalis TaxID=187101 RepID=A0A0E3ZC74_9FUSO|nr:helix-turn-helix domain-containing protein [Sneathia vaginalis]AKC95462.1 hypothetical protein VC03_02775 [Sneathia vaginalis]
MLDNNKQEPFYQVPKAFGNLLEEGKMSLIDIWIYTIMYDTYKITTLRDKQGNKYIKISYETLMKKLNINSKKTISRSIKNLVNLGFIKVEINKGKSTKYFIK